MSEQALFDTAQLLRQRLRHKSEAAGADFLLRRVSEEIADRLTAVQRRFDLAADIGTPGSTLAETLAGAPALEALVRVDAAAPLLGDNATGAVCDPEVLPLADASIDLAVSALSLQWINDLPGLLVQIRRALKQDGLFLAGFAGGETLHELRASFLQAEGELASGAAPRVIPFIDVREAGSLLQRAGLALPVADADRLTVRYDTPFGLIADLRAMGAANPLTARSRKPLRRDVLMRMAEIYRDRFADPDGRIRATFDIVYVSGWAPHESQQMPLRPGSATARLADALGTEEIPAGEKTGPEEGS